MRILTTLLVAPGLAVSAFQQSHTVAARRRLDTAFVVHSALVEEAPPQDLTPVTRGGSDLPPVLQDIVDERNEFQLNLGKAMDTLRKDYPYILREMPDFSIYHDSIKVVDPSDVQLSGLKNYKNAFLVFQTLIRFLYSKERSGLQYRMVYDFCRSSIRISWNAVLTSKIGGRPMYVDGISMYKLDPVSGKIVEHRIENLVINNSAVAPPYGIFSLLRDEIKPKGVPVGVGGLCVDGNNRG